MIDMGVMIKMATGDQYRDKVTLGGEDVIDLIDKSSDGAITSITKTGTEIVVTDKSGKKTTHEVITELPDINTSTLTVGPTSNVSYTFPNNKNKASTSFKIPYFTVDSKGRITSASTKTVTISRPAYSNYGNYASYTSYGSYSSYHNYSNYDRYGSND